MGTGCRNQSSHTYNQATADKITESVINSYFSLFKKFQHRMESLIN